MNEITVKGDLNDAFGLVLAKGLIVPQRASMLMAYGINGVSGERDISHNLPGMIQYAQTLQELSASFADTFHRDFLNWVVANGLREMIEGLDVFLADLFLLFLVANPKNNNLSQERRRKICTKFEHQGFSSKLAELEKRYDLQTGMARYFRSLNQARNCLSHRGGVVGEVDCDSDGHLHLEWLGIDAFYTEEDGTIHFVTLDTLGPIDTSGWSGDKAELTFEMKDRSLKFENGSRIEIAPRELQEICAMGTFTCLKLHQLFVNWLIRNGVFLNGGKLIDDPQAHFSIRGNYPDGTPFEI